MRPECKSLADLPQLVANTDFETYHLNNNKLSNAELLHKNTLTKDIGLCEPKLPSKSLTDGIVYDVKYVNHTSVDLSAIKFTNYLDTLGSTPVNDDIRYLKYELLPVQSKLDDLPIEIDDLDMEKTTNEKRARYIAIFKEYNYPYDESKIRKCNIKGKNSRLRFILKVSKSEKKAELILVDPNHLLATEKLEECETFHYKNHLNVNLL